MDTAVRVDVSVGLADILSGDAVNNRGARGVSKGGGAVDCPGDREGGARGSRHGDGFLGRGPSVDDEGVGVGDRQTCHRRHDDGRGERRAAVG